MSPEKAVARRTPEYRIAVRRASSLRGYQQLTRNIAPALGVSGCVVLSRGKRHAWEERCFCNTEEESDDDQMSVGTSTRSSGRHNGPQSSPGWDVHRRAGSSEEHIAIARQSLSFEREGVVLPRELHKHVSDVQD